MMICDGNSHALEYCACLKPPEHLKYTGTASTNYALRSDDDHAAAAIDLRIGHSALLLQQVCCEQPFQLS